MRPFIGACCGAESAPGSVRRRCCGGPSVGGLLELKRIGGSCVNLGMLTHWWVPWGSGMPLAVCVSPHGTCAGCFLHTRSVRRPSTLNWDVPLGGAMWSCCRRRIGRLRLRRSGEAFFCAAQVAHSVAREGPLGGPQGGVAVVVPLPHRILKTREVVPGCVLEVVAAVCGTQRRAPFVSIYLPPDGRSQVLDALQGMGALAAPEVYAGGDVTMQLHAPRDDGERDDGERLQAILARWGSCSIDDGRVARRSRTAQASLDILAVPGWDAWSWSTKASWHNGLSDHALCVAWRTSELRASGAVCSPATLRRLPPEACIDLRSRYAYLGQTFGVRSDWDLPRGAAAPGTCAPAEALPEDHLLSFACRIAGTGRRSLLVTVMRLP